MNTKHPSSGARARFQRPDRAQIRYRDFSLEQLLPSDHRARVLWHYVDSLDLSALYAKIRAVEGRPGRDPVDPRILMTLWMFATIESISSARQLNRLCERDSAYMWICGDVGVNYHLLADFRVAHGDFLAEFLTDTIATLIHQELITLKVVAQDGMRVRAHAGSSSFRRKKTLQQCRDEARQHVRQMQEEWENEDRDQNDSNARRQAAQERAAQEREQRIEKALQELKELEEQKEKRKKGTGKKARCSTTDPDARIMKMANGGFRPAYNVQFATDGDTRMIVGVDVTNSGSDRGQMSKMHEDIYRRYGKRPEMYPVDCGFATKEDITELERRGTKVLAPIFNEDKMRENGNDPYARQRGDTDEMVQFRQRMATNEAKELYKQRPSMAEFPNAECRNRGLQQFPVRGLEKARTVALWHAITFNFMRMLHLQCIPQSAIC